MDPRFKTAYLVSLRDGRPLEEEVHLVVGLRMSAQHDLRLATRRVENAATYAAHGPVDPWKET